MKRTLLSLLIPALLTCVSSAQEPQKRTFRILFPDRPTGTASTMFLFDGATSREVDLPGMNLSKEYELPMGPLRLSLLPAPIDLPKNLPADAPSVTVPEGMNDFYLVAMKDSSNKIAPVRLQVIDAGMDKIRSGQMMWLNLTQLTITGKLGSESIDIKPEDQTVVNAPRNDAGEYAVSLGYRKEGADTSYPICETHWTHNPLSRSLAFVIAKDNSTAPRVMVFPDFRPENNKKKNDETETLEK